MIVLAGSNCRTCTCAVGRVVHAILLPTLLIVGHLALQYPSSVHATLQCSCSSQRCGQSAGVCRENFCYSEWRVQDSIVNGRCERRNFCSSHSDRSYKNIFYFLLNETMINDTLHGRRVNGSLAFAARTSCLAEDFCTDKYDERVLFFMRHRCRLVDDKMHASAVPEGPFRRIAYSIEQAQSFLRPAIFKHWNKQYHQHPFINEHGAILSRAHYKRFVQVQEEHLKLHAVHVRVNVSEPDATAMHGCHDVHYSQHSVDTYLTAVTTYIGVMGAIAAVCVFFAGDARYRASLKQRREQGSSHDISMDVLASQAEQVPPSLDFLQRSKALKNNVTVKEKLTEGTFSTKYRCMWHPSSRSAPRDAIVKLYNNGLIFDGHWLQESLLFNLYRLKHENLLKCLECGIQAEGEARQMWAVLEQVNYSLAEYLPPRSGLSMIEAAHILRSTACGLVYLHEEEVGAGVMEMVPGTLKPRIAHGNLCPSSIFIRPDGEACIGDMDGAVVQRTHLLEGRRSRVEFGMTGYIGFAGNLRYASPELLSSWVDSVESFNVLQASDVYSFSLVMWEVISMCSPGRVAFLSRYRMAYADIAPETPCRMEMCDLVALAAYRPPLDSEWAESNFHLEVGKLMAQSWAADYQCRPDSGSVMRTLKRLADTMDEVTQSQDDPKYSRTSGTSTATLVTQVSSCESDSLGTPQSGACGM